MKRLLTIGHSYVVAENRRLAHEIALAADGRWSVTVAAPSRFKGDLRDIALEPLPGEQSLVEALPVRLGRSPHLMYFGDLARVMHARWDVVHSWEEPYVHATYRAARQAPPSAAFVVSTFQNISKRYPWPFSQFERTVMRRADGWIAFGHSVHAAVGGRAGYSGKPSRIIPPGVDTDRFAPSEEASADIRRQLLWSPEDFVVGYLGRFIPEKGLGIIMRSLERLSHPWRALFVGGGPMQADLEQFGRAHPGRVHVATGVRHSEVPRWLNAMSVLCAPSQTTPRWREQFGRMLIEAMACGVAVVASDSGEIPHVVEGAGIVIGEHDDQRWTPELERLTGVETRRHHGRLGRERALSHFSWPAVARRHLAFFESLAGEG